MSADIREGAQQQQQTQTAITRTIRLYKGREGTIKRVMGESACYGYMELLV